MCLSDQAFKSRLCHIPLSFATTSVVTFPQKILYVMKELEIWFQKMISL